MVGVRMGKDHAIQLSDTRIDELIFHIGTSVDQHAGRFVAIPTRDNDRTATAAVLGIGWVTIAPDAANARHTARRSTAENCDLKPSHQSFAFVNRRSKLAVVAFAKSSYETPNTSAPTCAVWTV